MPDINETLGNRDHVCTRTFCTHEGAVERGEIVEPHSTTDLDERVKNLVRLCEAYKNEPPSLFRGPNLSERGEGYNAGMRDMARAVLRTLGLTDLGVAA